MRYIADHDFHIHSTISPCCHDENQTPENILKYASESIKTQSGINSGSVLQLL